MVAAEFAEDDDRMLDLGVPDEEWDILYRMRLQVERDVLVELVDDGLAVPQPMASHVLARPEAQHVNIEGAAVPSAAH
jgi:hypothetical protein